MKRWYGGPLKFTWTLVASVVGALILTFGALPPRREATPPGSALTVRFKDIAASAGVHFVLDNCATPYKYQIEPMVAGVAVFDYNNDGLPDLYFANGAHIPELQKTGPQYWNRLYRNNGDGTFTDVTEQAGVKGEGYSMGVAAADYDNDGWEDLYVTGVNRNILYHNNHDGTFTDVTARAGVAGLDPQRGKTWSVAAGWFDYDNDGWLDLFVVNYCAWNLDENPYCAASRMGSESTVILQSFSPCPIFSIITTGTERLRTSRSLPVFARIWEKAWGYPLPTTTMTAIRMSLWPTTQRVIFCFTTTVTALLTKWRFRQEWPSMATVRPILHGHRFPGCGQ